MCIHVYTENAVFLLLMVGYVLLFNLKAVCTNRFGAMEFFQPCLRLENHCLKVSQVDMTDSSRMWLKRKRHRRSGVFRGVDIPGL